MKPKIRTNRRCGLTLVELLVVLVVLAFLAYIFMSGADFSNARPRALRIQCVSNQKQIGLAYHVWEGDHGELYPMAISETNGGTMEFTTGLNAFRHFQVMSNELSTPKVLTCPADARCITASNFTAFNNSNISFFVGVDVINESNAMAILSGDWNITNGTPIRNGILELTSDRPSGWTAKVHNGVGNIGMSDGSVRQVSIFGLWGYVTNSGVATNRLQMP